MKKSTNRLGCIILLCVLLFGGPTGCAKDISPQTTAPQIRVVTSVSVNCYEDGALLAQRYYTDAEKMQSVLTYLRLLRTYGTVQEEPEASQGICFEIILTRSDGTSKVYWQLEDRYLREESESWKAIDPEKALQLSLILQEMQSDPQL